MYITFKIEGNDCRLSCIFSDGGVYKVPGYYNVCLNRNALNYIGMDLNFEDTLENVKERVEHEEINPIYRSREFPKTFAEIF